MKRINQLPSNWKTIPQLDSVGKLELYQFSGIRDYVRGWAKFNELTETQKTLLTLMNDGLNGRLQQNDFDEYKDVVQFLMADDIEILRPAEMSLMQKNGLRNKFLHHDDIADLKKGGINSYEDETDGAYFRSLRDQLFGLEKKDVGEAQTFEEIKIRTALEEAWENGGHDSAEKTLDNIFYSREVVLEGVSPQWLDDYMNLHASVDLQPTVSSFFGVDSPATVSEKPDNVPLLGRETWEHGLADEVEEEFYSADEDEPIFRDEEKFFDPTQEVLRTTVPEGVELAEFAPVVDHNLPHPDIDEKQAEVEQPEIDPFAAEPYDFQLRQDNVLSDNIVADMVYEFPEYTNEQLQKVMQGQDPLDGKPLTQMEGRSAESYRNYNNLWNRERVARDLDYEVPILQEGFKWYKPGTWFNRKQPEPYDPSKIPSEMIEPEQMFQDTNKLPGSSKSLDIDQLQKFGFSKQELEKALPDSFSGLDSLGEGMFSMDEFCGKMIDMGKMAPVILLVNWLGGQGKVGKTVADVINISGAVGMFLSMDVFGLLSLRCLLNKVVGTMQTTTQATVPIRA